MADSTINFLLMVFTGVLVLVAVGQTFWTRAAFKAAKASADAAVKALAHAEKISQTQLRAYVSYESASLIHVGNAEPAAEVKLVNRGATPAPSVLIRLAVLVAGDKYGNPLSWMDVDPKVGFAFGTLGPGCTMTVHARMSDADRARFIDGPAETTVLQVKVVITYRDIFNLDRCLTVNAGLKKANMRRGEATSFETLDSGNTAD